MRLSWTLCLLLFGVHISCCSKAVEENNTGISGMQPAENASLNSNVPPRNVPSPSIESSRPNPRDVILFDGTNYLKKSGWKTPPKNDTYIDESYDQGDPERVTKSGKQVKTKSILYGYRTPWLHSQVFYYEGRDLDYLNGKFASTSFIEMSANDKVFFYAVFVEKAVSTSLSNSEAPDHEDPFGYQIMDADGDGIFETLLGVDGKNVVPDWVLR